MRNMSFALTETAIRGRVKTVTRRMGWKFLKPGNCVRAVKKVMGFKKGEKVEPLGAILLIESVSREPLNAITVAEVRAEGFVWPVTADGPASFVQMFCKHNRCKPDTEITRIQFRYLEKHSELRQD